MEHPVQQTRNYLVNRKHPHLTPLPSRERKPEGQVRGIHEIPSNQRGSVLLMTLFLISLGSAFVIGFLQVSTTDLQIVRNHQYSLRALYIADTGVEDAIYNLILDSHWNAGFTNKAFAGETYTVTITNNYPNPIIIDSVGTAGGSFQKHLRVQVTISGSKPPTINYWKEI